MTSAPPDSRDLATSQGNGPDAHFTVSCNLDERYHYSHMQRFRRKYMLMNAAVMVPVIIAGLVVALLVGRLGVPGIIGIMGASIALAMIGSSFLTWRSMRFYRLLEEHNCRLCPICEYPLPTERRMIWTCTECGSDVLAEELEAYWMKHVATFRRVDPPMAK